MFCRQFLDCGDGLADRADNSFSVVASNSRVFLHSRNSLAKNTGNRLAMVARLCRMMLNSVDSFGEQGRLSCKAITNNRRKRVALLLRGRVQVVGLRLRRGRYYVPVRRGSCSLRIT